MKCVLCFDVYMTVSEKGFGRLPWVPDQVTLKWPSTDHHKSTDSNFSFCLFCQSANDGHISALWSPAWMVWQQHRVSIKHLWLANPTALWGIMYAIWAEDVFIKPEIDHVNSPTQHSLHHNQPLFQLTYFQLSLLEQETNYLLIWNGPFP